MIGSAQAIEFDKVGQRMESLRSFQAAVRFGESADTFVNLGVCFMRLGTAATDRKEKVFVNPFCSTRPSVLPEVPKKAPWYNHDLPCQ